MLKELLYVIGKGPGPEPVGPAGSNLAGFLVTKLQDIHFPFSLGSHTELMYILAKVCISALKYALKPLLGGWSQEMGLKKSSMFPYKG